MMMPATTAVADDHARTEAGPPPFDVATVRAEFPALTRTMRGRRLAYLDSGASAQKPRAMLDAVHRAYAEDYANVHRGTYELSEKATLAYEGARETIRRFVNAESLREVIFTKGATEAINLIARTWGEANVGPGDEIVLTGLEHHSNIVPWQMLRDKVGARIRVAPVTGDGQVDLDALRALLNERTRVVAFAHVSNVLGTVLPVAEICAMARAVGAISVVDGCQGIVHRPVDVQALGCDFYVFSGHKLYGPTGVGVLWGREALLEAMPPWLGGGDMIDTVTFEETTYAGLPARFEAGTPAIVQAIGLGAAVEWLSGLDLAGAHAHEADLHGYAVQRMAAVPGLRLHGTAPGKSGIISFSMAAAHPHDVATILDRAGVAVRAGHHCCQPLMATLGVPATARASFGIYTDREDVDQLVRGLETVADLFG